MSEMMTITEGLAEVKTIAARIETKKANVLRYLSRDARAKDPLQNEGSSVEYVRRGRQGIADLFARLVQIRTAIQRANSATTVKIGDKEQSVLDWLNWRREVSGQEQAWLTRLVNEVTKIRTTAHAQKLTIVQEQKDAQPGEWIINLNETQLAAEAETLQRTLGELDGRLSLINATVKISVP